VKAISSNTWNAAAIAECEIFARNMIAGEIFGGEWSGSAPRASPAPMMAAMSSRAEVIVTMAPAPAAVCAPMSAVVTDPGAIVAMALDSISAGMSAWISKFKVVARRRRLQREEESGKRDSRRRHFSYSHSELLSMALD
jgi:hypothetical protein